MSSLKRSKAENTADFRVYVDTEDPDCKSPRKKKSKTAENQVGPSPFGERSCNLSTHQKVGNKENGGSEVSAHLPHSGVGSPIRPRNKEKTEDQDPMKLLDDKDGAHSPRSPRVDDYFKKIFKNVSPKRENTERSPGKIFYDMCDGAEDLNIAPHIKWKLLERSKSVCKIDVTGVESKQGTGSVFNGNLIMTCAHLFRGFLEGKKLKEGTNVSVLFNFHGPQPISNNFVFAVEKIIVAISEDLDYIFLMLRTDVKNSNQRVPPGLLEQFGPVTENGEIFIIGHPRGEAKKIDSTFLIELGMREQAVNNHLAPHQDRIFFPLSINQIIENRGIEHIKIGGAKANKVATYSTREMYEGTSGSPVLNADGQLILMHTGGYGYGFPFTMNSVLEYGQRLDLIIPDLVRQLKESGNVQLLERIMSVASKNEHLKKVLETDPMEVD